jgi:hypothetical protein
VTERLPGETTPAPPVKTALRLKFVPLSIVAGLAVKLVMAGAGLTVTVAVWVMAVPTEGVTVKVYVVVAVGLTLTGVPLATERLPGVMTPVPPLKTAVRLELVPASMVVGLAAKLVMAGGAAGEEVVVAADPQPPQLASSVADATTAKMLNGRRGTMYIEGVPLRTLMQSSWRVSDANPQLFLCPK